MTTLPHSPAPQAYSLLWDECAFLDSRAQDFLESGIAETESEAFEMASLDHEFLGFEFEDFLESFTGILHHISPKGRFFVTGENMGWRHLSGAAIIEAQDAGSFIARAFPKTSEWILRGHFDRQHRILTYTLSHHDAPTGEFYAVRACRGEERRRA